MGINNIVLTSHMLAGLFPDSLVETNATTVPESAPLNYLGSNKKNILAIVSHVSVPFLPDSELNFLSNILAACKLGIADIGIVNYKSISQTEIQNLISSEARQVILFNVDPPSIGLPINFPQFQLQPFNGRTYLYVPALPEIENNKEAKAKLWSALKVLFGL